MSDADAGCGIQMAVGQTHDADNLRDDIASLWIDLTYRFRLLSANFDNVDVPTQNEIDAFKMSLAHPNLVTSPLRDQFNFGYFMEPDGPVRDETIAAIKGALGPDNLVVEKCAVAFRDKALSPSLLKNWGQLNFAAGMLTALLLDGDRVEKRFETGLKGAKNGDTTLQQYWYARWVASRILDDHDKAQKDDELAELCSDIAQGLRDPVVHSKEWFAVMVKRIDESTEQGWVLKTTYTRLPHSELERMAANALIPATALPPLSIDDFPSGGHTHP